MLELRTAGNKPNRIPVENETPTANDSTRQSSEVAPNREMVTGAAGVRLLLASPRRHSGTPPESASKRFSVRSWRIMRNLLGAPERCAPRFTGAVAHTREQQVRDVGADDEQDESNRAEEQH